MARNMTMAERMRAAEATAQHWQEIAQEAVRQRGADKDQLYWELRQAEEFIRNLGYARCNVPACNCNSWHKREITR